MLLEQIAATLVTLKHQKFILSNSGDQKSKISITGLKSRYISSEDCGGKCTSLPFPASDDCTFSWLMAASFQSLPPCSHRVVVLLGLCVKSPSYKVTCDYINFPSSKFLTSLHL